MIELIRKIILFITPNSWRLTERDIDIIRSFEEKAEFMEKRGYRSVISRRGGFRWERIKPDSYYKGKQNPFFEYLEYKGKIDYSKDLVGKSVKLGKNK